MTYVVDSSVAVKWVVPEVLSDEADRILAGDDPLIAPDLLQVEAANALWKKAARKEISGAATPGRGARRGGACTRSSRRGPARRRR
jgi:predicted nucleic acid-binding protein